MGTLWRSTEMRLVQMFVQVDAAKQTVDELGKLGLVQFKDLNSEVSAFQRNFVKEVRQCEEMERRLVKISKAIELEEEQIRISKGLEPDNDSIMLVDRGTVPLDQLQVSFDELDNQLEDLEKELDQMRINQDKFNKNYAELIELNYVLKKDSTFFSETAPEISHNDEDTSLLGGMEEKRGTNLGFLTGVMKAETFPQFERVLWRALRGNLFMKHSEIEELITDPVSGRDVKKIVFIIFYQGERSHSKIKKLCEAFGANGYICPATHSERKDLGLQVEQRIQDLEKVRSRTQQHRRNALFQAGQYLQAWSELVMKEKAVYDTMNKFNFDKGRKCLMAEGWIPAKATDDVKHAMRRATEKSGSTVPSILSLIPTAEDPPTYFETDKFTQPFQALVDAYGMAHYQEVNPGVFTIVTFPFLFGVMFGDMGHGLLFLLFSFWLIYMERVYEKPGAKIQELLAFCYHGRYLLLVMSIMAIYMGLIYNEFYSVTTNFFDSRYRFNLTADDGQEHPCQDSSDISCTARYVGTSSYGTYLIGVDPIWLQSSNGLTFYNSLKMKMSVLLGVTQMLLGIVLSFMNARHFKKPLNIYFEFIPQMVFMLSIFGYMCFLIILKWTYTVDDWDSINRSPPLILNIMIQMFLSPTSLKPENQILSSAPLQHALQVIFLVFAIISVPIMLCVKPCILKKRHEASMKGGRIQLEDDHEEEESSTPAPSGGGHDDHGEGGEFDFGEVFIKQIIHTIEFVLGAISNTASYLRLWALSLAHSELAAVFWDLVLIGSYKFGSGAMTGIMVFVGWAIWAGATVGVLLVMESLSAFLHALRLHWVEFQNKFYMGDGKAFTPFSYKALLTTEDSG